MRPGVGGPGRPGGSGGSGGYGGGPGGPGGPGDGDGLRRRSLSEDKEAKTGWKRYVPSWKIVVGAGALGVIAVGVLIGVGYAMTPVPTDAQHGVTDQGSFVYYNDNKTRILRVGGPRENVSLDKIPPKVRAAVLAAEDRNFYNEGAISITGIGRALVSTATGGGAQGGSTITQQLARNYYAGLSQERTLSRKYKEIFISIKVGNELQKNQILERYLNTITFGRQSEGIQSAAHAYFHEDVSKLNLAQGAMLAAMIQQPSYFHATGDMSDPAHAALVARWKYVLNGLVEMKVITPQERDAQTFPKVKTSWSDIQEDGQTPYIRERILAELKSLNIDDRALNKGLKIYTTLDSNAMDAAQKAVTQTAPAGMPKGIGIGLISVDSRDGSIRGFYGGNSKVSQFDNVFQSVSQVGSSFKPYVLATALKRGDNVHSMIDGHSPQAFDNNGDNLPVGTPHAYVVHNDSGEQAGVIDLVKATQMSVNTAYVKLGLKVGLNDVRDTAEDFGVPRKALDQTEGGGLSLGQSSYAAVYQAAGYAAFANGGYAVKPHLIKRITTNDGKNFMTHFPWDSRKKILEPDQAAQATYAMQAVLRRPGTGYRAALPDRQAAGKTGTTSGNAAAWFVGYVPQMSTAVTMFNKAHPNKTMTGIPGYAGGVYGGTIPALIWKAYMMKATQDMEVKQFPAPQFIGNAMQWDTPKPTPTPTPSNSPGPNNCGPQDFYKPRCRNQNQSPPPNTGQPCTSPGVPAGCDPNAQPTRPSYCQKYPTLPACQSTDPNGGSGGNGSGGNGSGGGGGQTTTQSYGEPRRLRLLR